MVLDNIEFGKVHIGVGGGDGALLCFEFTCSVMVEAHFSGAIHKLNAPKCALLNEVKYH